MEIGNKAPEYESCHYMVNTVCYQCKTYGMSVWILSNICYCMVVQISLNNRQEMDIGTCEGLVICDILYIRLILTGLSKICP